MVFIVVVDGLIASGKSSVLRLLSSKYGYLVEQQRVSDWTLLKPFYENPKLYAEPLQYQILESYHKIWQNYQEGSNKKIGKKNSSLTRVSLVLLEAFSLSSFEVFAKMLQDDGVINDEKIQEIETFARENQKSRLYPNIFFYLDCDPKKCMERIKIRARPGEENIQLQYMERLSLYYENFIQNYKEKMNIVRLDNNVQDQADFIASKINDMCVQRNQ
jgi:deoxyguanosine kinase